jgi:hypothetical protein
MLTGKHALIKRIENVVIIKIPNFIEPNPHAKEKSQHQNAKRYAKQLIKHHSKPIYTLVLKLIQSNQQLKLLLPK